MEKNPKNILSSFKTFELTVTTGMHTQFAEEGIHECVNWLICRRIRVPHSGSYDNIFCDTTPCNRFQVLRRFEAKHLLHFRGRIIQAEWLIAIHLHAVSRSTYWAMKMEASRSFKASIHFQRTTWRLISDDRTLNNSCLLQQPDFIDDLASESKVSLDWTSTLVSVSELPASNFDCSGWSFSAFSGFAADVGTVLTFDYGHFLPYLYS
jgi:hypothetical protein